MLATAQLHFFIKHKSIYLQTYQNLASSNIPSFNSFIDGRKHGVASAQLYCTTVIDVLESHIQYYVF